MNGPASVERIVSHLAFARAVAARSLDPRCRGADREDLIAWGIVGLVQAAERYRGDLGASIVAEAEHRDPRWDGVARELRALTKLERRVIVLSYGRGLTLREIGLQVGL